MSYYTVRELHRDGNTAIYSIYEPSEVFCYLVVGEKAAILYDATFGLGDLAGAVRGIEGVLHTNKLQWPP